jgi:hypothetical protein
VISICMFDDLLCGMYRKCEHEECDKHAQSGTNFCIRHGGGRKCQVADCTKVARGTTPYCGAHGGGVRCTLDGCNRVVLSKQTYCPKHTSSEARTINSIISEIIPTESNDGPITVTVPVADDAVENEDANVTSAPSKKRQRGRTGKVKKRPSDKSSDPIVNDAIVDPPARPSETAIEQLLISDEILLANDALLMLEFLPYDDSDYNYFRNMNLNASNSSPGRKRSKTRLQTSPSPRHPQASSPANNGGPNSTAPAYDFATSFRNDDISFPLFPLLQATELASRNQ